MGGFDEPDLEEQSTQCLWMATAGGWEASLGGSLHCTIYEVGGLFCMKYIKYELS